MMGLGLLSSCNIEDDSTAVIPFVPGVVENPVTISQLIIANPNLTILERALRVVEAETNTRLITDLNIPGNSTFFAPSDAAFMELLATNGIDNIEDITPDDLIEILQNHILPIEVMSANLQTGYFETALESDDNDDLNISMFINTAEGVVINGNATVVMPDIDANNGVIHIVDAVIQLPTIATFTGNDPSLSGFHNTVIAQGLRPIVGALATRAAFVPTNEAFNAFASGLDIAEEGEEQDPLVILNLRNTLQNHVVVDDLSAPELLDMSDEENPFMVETIAESNLSINVTTSVEDVDDAGVEVTAIASFTITDALGNVANTVTTDVQASNGTLTIINAVLQPEPILELPVVEEEME